MKGWRERFLLLPIRTAIVVCEILAIKQISLYYKLFNKLTRITMIFSVYIILNTPFNENETNVCHFLETLDCFPRIKMDVLLIGKFLHNEKTHE
jgi:predicted NodU family carbamoyl transferase